MLLVNKEGWWTWMLLVDKEAVGGQGRLVDKEGVGGQGRLVDGGNKYKCTAQELPHLIKSTFVRMAKSLQDRAI